MNHSTRRAALHLQSEPIVPPMSDGIRQPAQVGFVHERLGLCSLTRSPMRGSVIAGIGLIVIGVAVYVRGGSFTTRRDVLKIGDVSVSAEEQRPIAPWIAGLAVLAGIALVATGARSKA